LESFSSFLTSSIEWISWLHCVFLWCVLKVVRVVLSSRLTKTPCALISAASGYTANQERIIRAQALSDERIRQYVQNGISHILPIRCWEKQNLKKKALSKSSPSLCLDSTQHPVAE
jgi:HSP90 family molecular chaperone